MRLAQIGLRKWQDSHDLLFGRRRVLDGATRAACEIGNTPRGANTSQNEML